MSTDAPLDDETTWRRRFASRANNRGWALAEQPTRTASEDAEMLDAAHASAHLWRPIGTDRNAAHANLLLAQVHALLDHTALATRYADAAHAFLATGESDPWELALSHAIVAHAAYRRGDGERHRAEYAIAKARIDAIDDREEQDVLRASLRVVPSPEAT